MDMGFPGSPQGSGFSMPSAVPGMGGGGASMLGQLPPPGGSPAAPIGAPSFGGMGMPGDPASAQYKAMTQSDGTVLLHMLLPNGELGPAVKIISLGSKPRPSM